MSQTLAFLLRYRDALALWLAARLDKFSPQNRLRLATMIALVAGLFGFQLTGSESTIIATVLIYFVGGIIDFTVSRIAAKVESKRAETVKYVTIKPDIVALIAAFGLLSGCAGWSANLVEATATADGSGSIVWTEAGGASSVGAVDIYADTVGEVCYRANCVDVVVSLDVESPGEIVACWSVGIVRVCRAVPAAE